jgi:hypothetical protein
LKGCIFKEINGKSFYNESLITFMAEIITQFEYLAIGAAAIALGSVVFYKAITGILSGILQKHWFIFLDTDGKIKEIIVKYIRRGKTSIRHRKNEYQIDPTHRYHILAYDEKNELVVHKNGTIDSLVKVRTVEEYELMAFSLLSRLLQGKIRAVDLVMLLLMGVVAVVVLYGLIHGQK